MQPSGEAVLRISELEAQVARLTAILNITKEINSKRDVDSLLRIIVEEGARVVAADRGTLWMLDRVEHVLWARVALGIEGGEEIRIPADSGISGYVVRSGQVVNIRDPYSDPRFNPDVDRKTGYRTRSVLAVPMFNQEHETLGVLQVLNKTGGLPFGAEDEDLLLILAAQAAIAIENARSFSDLKRTAERVESGNERLRAELAGSFIGTSPRIQEIRELIDRIAQSPVTVLLTGESGTGKTHLAKLIHYKSQRYDKPFVGVNCAAIPEPLVESELFGIEKGVATGVEKKIGRIEMSEGGTLFLDEIADMSPAIQAKVLQVLQEKEFVRVGGRSPIRVDVRFVSATNKDLPSEVQRGRFREDLYYRLNVLNIQVPPIRERKEDLFLLVDYLLQRTCQEYNRRIPNLAAATRAALAAHDWPGNVREVENEIRRLVSLAPDDGSPVGPLLLSDRVLSVEARRLPAAPGRGEGGDGATAPASGISQTLDQAVETLERRIIRDALSRTQGNKAQAARILGLSREGLRKKLTRYGML